MPAGYQVDLYENENLGGAHERVYGMQTSDGAMTCVKLNVLHNALSSFTYGPLQLGKAIGSWMPVQTVNYPIKKEITIGVTTSVGASTEISAAASFNASMEAGIEFMGVGGKTNLSSSYEASFRKTVDELTSMTRNETISYGCGDKEDGSEMYGLWQWVA